MGNVIVFDWIRAALGIECQMESDNAITMEKDRYTNHFPQLSPKDLHER